jgi:hypothetical protein
MVTAPHLRRRVAALLAIAAVPLLLASAHAQLPDAVVHVELIDRFLEPDESPLVSYRAFRHLTASTRGGRMTASVDAWTTLDPVHGFNYEVTSRAGSGLIQGRVLVAALQAEQDAHRASDPAQSALTRANYEFLDITPETGRLVKVDVKPRRKHVMLVQGALFVEPASADLVRIEGELSKRPSFWTRRVRVVRDYERIEGVHVPVSMRSTADVLIVGASSFEMTYRYSEINGKVIPQK